MAARLTWSRTEASDTGLRQDAMTVSTAAGQVSAPVAPGRMGSPLDPRAAQVYLDELGR